jgi:transglutaminase-like putative cysteine protease
MRSRLRVAFPVALLLLAGCRVVATAIVIPIAVVMVVCAGLAGLFVGDDQVSDEQELSANGLRIVERLLDVEVADDGTCAGRLVEVLEVTSALGLKAAQQPTLTYDPRSQVLELVSAKVINPDGTVRVVAATETFERPSALDRGAAGFVSTKEKCVLLPHLVLGSQTHVEWRFEDNAPSSLGFSYTWRPRFALPVTLATIRITHGDGLALRADAEAPFVLERSTDGAKHTLTATLRDYEGQVRERSMVGPADVCPRFVVTTHADWESIGAAFHTAVASRTERSPAIDAAADEIVGERTGLEAARAIHRWVCRNISYVKLDLHPMDGWVPSPASQVLETRYGDCKDKYVLLASLLAARGIAVEPVLVNLDRSFDPLALPSPLQFDHCMAYLPELGLYSNPTDPFHDLGELALTLTDKFVVHATETGRVSRTPAGTADGNLYEARHTATLGQDGIFRGQSETHLRGRLAGPVRRILGKAASPGEAADGLLQAEALGGVGVVVSSDPTDLDTPLECGGGWHTEVPIPMGPSIYFSMPSGIEFVNAALIREFLTTHERRYPVLLMATDIRWRHELTLPAGYTLDTLPVGRSRTTGAGLFESSYQTTSDGRIVIERHLRIERDRYAPEEYDGLRTILLEAMIDIETIMAASLSG